MTTETTRTLEQLAADSRQLANDVFSHDDTACSQRREADAYNPARPSCMTAEEQRPLTKDEKRQGWTRRPFYAYDSARMCAGCAAYYFAERAAQTLHEMRCWQMRAEAVNRAKR